MIIERWEKNELWLVDKNSFDGFENSLNGPVNAKASIDIGGNGDSGKCKIASKWITKFFSYVTVLSDKSMDAFKKWQSEIWDFNLMPTDLLNNGDKKQQIFLGNRGLYKRPEPTSDA